MNKPKNMVGREVGRLRVIGLSARRGTGGEYYWNCECKCGGTAELRTTQINSGVTKSCGCLSREALSARTRKHGKGRTPEAAIWRAMVGRCHNPKNRAYRYYGAKGIKVCIRWRKSFLRFLKDMGPHPKGYHLDRFPDKMGDYRPENCRWTTVKNNQRNRTNNVQLTINGTTKLAIEWAEERGIPYGTVWDRINKGWKAEDCLRQSRKRRA